MDSREKDILKKDWHDVAIEATSKISKYSTDINRQVTQSLNDSCTRCTTAAYGDIYYAYIRQYQTLEDHLPIYCEFHGRLYYDELSALFPSFIKFITPIVSKSFTTELKEHIYRKKFDVNTTIIILSIKGVNPHLNQNHRH